MRPVYNMTKFMKHGVHHLFEWEELPFVTRVPKPQTYFLAFVPVEAQQIVFRREELCKNTNSPGSLSHDRFHKARDFAESLEGFSLARAELLMLIFGDKGVMLEHLVDECYKIAETRESDRYPPLSRDGNLNTAFMDS